MVHSEQQSSRTGNASGLLQWRGRRSYEQRLIPRYQLRQNAHEQEAVQMTKRRVYKKIPTKKRKRQRNENKNKKLFVLSYQRHRTASYLFPAVSEYDTWCHWTWYESHNPVTVQPVEALNGALKSHDAYWTCHHLEFRCKVEQVNAPSQESTSRHCPRTQWCKLSKDTISDAFSRTVNLPFH